MFRCVSLAALAIAAALPTAAHALRPFPSTALRGVIVVTQPPEVLLNGRDARLAPGARIRGVDNLLLLSGSIAGRQALVHYTLDPSGNLMDVWVLTPEEMARKPWPETPEQAARWQFDAASQTWIKR